MDIFAFVRQYLPHASDDEIESLLRHETDYFSGQFPSDGRTPRESLEMQIARAVSREIFGEYGYRRRRHRY